MKKVTLVSYNLIAKIVAMFCFYLQDILLARLLGINGYAEWTFFFSITTVVFWVANLGINNAMQVIVAKDENNQRSIFNHIVSGMVLRILVSGAFSVFIMLIARPACIAANAEERYSHLPGLLILGAIYSFLYLVVEFWKNTSIGLKRTDRLLIITVFEHVGYVGWSVIFYYIFKNVYGIIIGYIVSYGITLFVSEKTYGIRKQKYLFESQEFKNNLSVIFSMSYPYIIASLSTFVLTEMDTIMLGSMQSDSVELALYVVAKKVIMKLPHFNDIILTAMMVDFAVITIDNLKKRKDQFREIFTINSLCIMIISGAIVLGGKYAVKVLYGEEFSLAYKYLLLLLPGFVITAVNKML